MASTNGHGPKRVVLYARVSTNEQARSGYSLRQQVERLRDHAASEGYEVLEEGLDPGQSGASLDVYKPHTYEEMEGLVSPEVAARLDRSKLYGIWWYNRTRTKVTQVSAIGQNGKAYRRRFESTPRPRGE